MSATMTAMRKLAATVLSVCCVSVSVADVEWLSAEYDFGVIKEAAGPRTGQVRFVNHGPGVVAVNDVRPSCGCTGADYTRGEIMPGDTATVSFTYDPKGRPGRFEKTVKVYVGPDNEKSVITMRGTVIGAPSTLMSRYPYEAGPLRLSDKTLLAGDVRYGTARHMLVQGYNQSSDTIRPAWRHTAGSISIGASQPAVGPGDLVTFSIYFNTRDGEEPGDVDYPITFIADSGAPEEQTFTVSFRARVTPDTSRMTPGEVADGPRIDVIPEIVDVGVVKRAEAVPFGFAIRNDGRSRLTVGRITSPAVPLVIKRLPVRLKPGETGTVEGTADIGDIEAGAFSIVLDIASDDPLHPMRRVRLSGIAE